MDDFISDEEAQNLINFYEKNKEKASDWHGTSTLPLDENFSDLGFRINHFINNFGAEIDWGKIVCWPKGSFQPLHFDNASDNTILTSVSYLNDSFKGGQTHFEDQTSIAPVKRRSLFFDGTKYKHGVNEIEEGQRYTLAIWYKKQSK
jgi:hypothetical protein